MIISVFCKSCEPICEPEIIPVWYHLENQNKNNFTFSVQFTNLTKLVLHWKFWRKYQSILHLFSSNLLIWFFDLLLNNYGHCAVHSIARDPFVLFSVTTTGFCTFLLEIHWSEKNHSRLPVFTQVDCAKGPKILKCIFYCFQFFSKTNTKFCSEWNPSIVMSPF